MRRSLVVLMALSIAVLGCSTSDRSRSTTTSSTGSTDAEGVPAVRLTQLTTTDEPIALMTHPRSKIRYVAERAGIIRPLEQDRLGPPVLDLSSRTNAQGERGLLGAAFASDGTWLYVHYTNLDGDTRVDAFPFAEGRADVGGRREILTQDQPFPNHNGGALITGPDGLLYLGLGDGGSQGDPQGNGQKLSTWLGKVLRIEPTPTAAEPYRVPSDNPFVGTSGARPEIWTYGLRNPWRFSFDRANGDLWIGDVGWDGDGRLPGRRWGMGDGCNDDHEVACLRPSGRQHDRARTILRGLGPAGLAFVAPKKGIADDEARRRRGQGHPGATP
jgi:glucose/arabinose dehydrogenase